MRHRKTSACAITGLIKRRQGAVDALGVLFRADNEVIAEDHRFEWPPGLFMDAVTQAQIMLPWGDARECHRNLTSEKTVLYRLVVNVSIFRGFYSTVFSEKISFFSKK